MAWSPETNTHFLATGANDNLVHVWDDRNVSAPIHTFSDHQAAIKVSFSSCQRNLIKTFQIEAMIALITKMILIFS